MGMAQAARASAMPIEVCDSGAGLMTMLPARLPRRFRLGPLRKQLAELSLCSHLSESPDDIGHALHRFELGAQAQRAKITQLREIMRAPCSLFGCACGDTRFIHWCLRAEVTLAAEYLPGPFLDQPLPS